MKYNTPYVATTSHVIGQRVMEAFAEGCGAKDKQFFIPIASQPNLPDPYYHMNPVEYNLTPQLDWSQGAEVGEGYWSNIQKKNTNHKKGRSPGKTERKIKPIKRIYSPPSDVATYGVLRGAGEILRSAEEYWYIDRSYFCPKMSETNRIVMPEEISFRITRNNTIHSGEGDHDWDRFYSLRSGMFRGCPTDNIDSYTNLPCSWPDWTWKKNGRHIVVVPSSKYMFGFLGIEGWLADTLRDIIKHTDRDIYVSKKKGEARRLLDYAGAGYNAIPSKHNGRLLAGHPQIKDADCSLDEVLQDAWVLVTDSSNCMVDALLRGIPIICTHPNRKIGSIKEIESPVYDREILKNLAYNQWTMKQIRSGQAWEELNEWG